METLHAKSTSIDIHGQPWALGIVRLAVAGQFDIAFNLHAFGPMFFFQGQWPRPPDFYDYEPADCASSIAKASDESAIWRQPTTPYSKVESTVTYSIADKGTVDVVFETTSHAESYHRGYVGSVWCAGIAGKG